MLAPRIDAHVNTFDGKEVSLGKAFMFWGLDARGVSRFLGLGLLQ